MSVVQPVQDHAHALVRRNQYGDAQHPANGRQGAVAAARVGQSQHDGDHGAEQDERDAEPPCKEDARRVAVADGPADEVGVRLTTQRGFDRRDDDAECGRVRRMCKRLKYGFLLLVGEVELPGRVVHDISGDHTVDFFSEGLYGDCLVWIFRQSTLLLFDSVVDSNYRMHIMPPWECGI